MPGQLFLDFRVSFIFINSNAQSLRSLTFLCNLVLAHLHNKQLTDNYLR